MKIKPEHYQAILAHFKRISEVSTIGEYREKLKSDPRVKDVEKRLRWDISYAGGTSTEFHKFITSEIYKYANDDHLDTAFKKAMKELGL